MRTLLIWLAAVSFTFAAPPKPAKVDLSKVTRANILKMIDHQRELNAEADAKIDSLAKKLAAAEDKQAAAEAKLGMAEDKATAVQRTLDTLRLDLFKAEKALAVQTKRAWKWTFISIGEGVLILGLLAWIFKKPILRLCGVPVP